jgi:membrane-associated phospholipid phosphatase
MVLGAHYLMDVLTGMILGILFAFISILLYNKLKEKIKKRKHK